MKPLHNLPVAIVGAGPVGLALAARLSTFNIASVIFDKAPFLQKKGSKACLIQGDVLEILEKIGCATRLAQEGIHWRIAHTYIKGLELEPQHFPERAGFGQFINISQYRIEQELGAFIATTELTEIHWQHEVIAMEQHKDSVTLTLQTPDEVCDEHFRYVVACDGVRSKIRDLAGQNFSGYTHRTPFLITDIRANIALTKERHFWFDPPFHKGKQLVMHPQPDNVWRIDWQLEENDDIEKEKINGKLDQRIRKVIGNIPYEINWLSTYRFNQKVIDQFRHGNLFFAGDSAHSLPPYGSRGMNSGIQDADNLAWKLAWVINGLAPDALLDSYHQERRPAALENLRVTEETMRFIAPSERGIRIKRNLILLISRFFPQARRWINHGKMAEPFTYASSSLIHKSPETPLVGQFLPDMCVFIYHQRTRLRKLLGVHFTCLCFAEEISLAAFTQLSQQCRAPFEVKFVAVVPRASFEYQTETAITVADYDDILAAQQFMGSQPLCYLVRPDGHIAAQFYLSEMKDINELIHLCAMADSDINNLYQRTS
ncbi:FAD-dependent monooxygenase [Yersinia alsatica]|uniref:FAD-dependent monooxygenase n=1 Tax=Yersinia alsatica TaxID=2890317 RepID=A0ABY5UK74_9GAMM|nr:FAD-dependent monooxygenase [Yersinia alsatica]OWF70610.1 FAD-dependent oxidoreductase [Yersinia frederiksenii]UWM43854.1 FAD-dependent monooxygenase [Yersinia alsatica]